MIPRQKQAVAYCLATLAAFALRLPSIGAASQRIHLTPNFTMGESFRYHIESQTTTTGTTTTPIVNPEAAKQLKQVADLEVRLDVVGVQPAPAASGAPGAARLRATYEKATAATQTDAYDPAAAALDAQYNNLQGRSVEFTIEADGKISHISGLDEAVSNPSAAAAVRDWITGFSPSANLPPEGIAVGQKWSAERPLENTPLGNLLWRTSSSYLRDEACELPGQSTSAAPAGHTCSFARAALRRDSHQLRYPAPRLRECRRHAGRLSPQRIAHLRHVDWQRRNSQHHFAADRHAVALHANQHAKNGLRNRQRALRLENSLRRPGGNAI